MRNALCTGYSADRVRLLTGASRSGAAACGPIGMPLAGLRGGAGFLGARLDVGAQDAVRKHGVVPRPPDLVQIVRVDYHLVLQDGAAKRPLNLLLRHAPPRPGNRWRARRRLLADRTASHSLSISSCLQSLSMPLKTSSSEDRLSGPTTSLGRSPR